MKNRILVTGAAGFIGSNLIDTLLKYGHEVLGIDNFDGYYKRTIKEGNIEAAKQHKQFQFHEGDIRNNAFLDGCFTQFNPNLVVHLAAKAGVRPSIIDPHGYYDVNVMGTLNLLEMMRKHNVDKLIFASSSSVYGNNFKVPFSESDVVDNPISPYAASKKAGELLCHTYHHLYNFDIYCLRFFTVYGPRQRPDLAIHKFTKALYGNDSIPFYGDGTTKRDYTHIDDILQGIVNSISQINLLRGYHIFNLGESKTISLVELVGLLEKYTGRKAKLDYLPLQEGDVAQTYADICKAREFLKYSPKISIEKGLEDFIKWYISYNKI